MNQARQSSPFGRTEPAVGPPATKPAQRDLARPGDRILFAMSDGTQPGVSLERAAGLARTLGGELHVVAVFPVPNLLDRLFPPINAFNAYPPKQTAPEAEARTRAWIASVLGDELTAERVRLRSGHLVAEVAAHARQLDAALIVLGPGERHPGTRVTTLAREANLPVLVAREPGLKDTIIAATDLEDERYHVLHDAARLSLRLHAPLVAVHNVAPLSENIGAPTGWPAAVMPDDLSDARRHQLECARDLLEVRADMLIAHEPNATDAILRVARARDVDLIVVGTRSESWFNRLFSSRVAAKVVNRAKRSVLVTPLEARARAG